MILSILPRRLVAVREGAKEVHDGDMRELEALGLADAKHQVIRQHRGERRLRLVGADEQLLHLLPICGIFVRTFSYCTSRTTYIEYITMLHSAASSYSGSTVTVSNSDTIISSTSCQCHCGMELECLGLGLRVVTLKLRLAPAINLKLIAES